jgi:hypothetical protein
MRLLGLLFVAILAARPAAAQPPQPSTNQTPASSSEDQGSKETDLNLPVSLDKIKVALQQPAATVKLSLRNIEEPPTFRLQIEERQRIQELLATLNYKAGPTPAGGVYAAEIQRQIWNPVDHPLQQPYAPFNQPELATILIENLVARMLAGRASDAISKWGRERAEAAAREEVRQAVREYCLHQPNNGDGLYICDTNR